MHSKKVYPAKFQRSRGFVIPLIIAIVAILAIGGVVFTTTNKKVEAPKVETPISTSTAPIVGGDKDTHGCIGSAGYSWCAVKNKCLRVWEEKCEVATTSEPVICTADAQMCSDGSWVGRTGPKCEFICPTTDENSFCGGIAGVKCAAGLTCKLDGTYPDAGGKCIK